MQLEWHLGQGFNQFSSLRLLCHINRSTGTSKVRREAVTALSSLLTTTWLLGGRKDKVAAALTLA